MAHSPASTPASSLLAIRAMNAIGDQSRWWLDVPESIASYADWHVHARIPKLVILPTTRPLTKAMRMMNELLRGTHGEGLIVSVNNADEPRTDLGIVILNRHERRWFVPMTLWLGDADLWIVPDPWHPAVRAECFHVVNGRLVPAPAPWLDQAEQQAGLLGASTRMARRLG